MWWKNSVVYQIYPRSFADSNGDGIGDLNGITAHLDYLQKLGVDVVWLSPVYQSPNDDNGYDISDYQNIMQEFGTMEEFDRMLAEMHKRGIRLVMDLVVNHTSDEHAWFIESKKSKENPYRDFYIWREGKDGKEPNNWGACFGGSTWEYDRETDMYYLHCFSKKQPDLNWENKAVRNNIYEMMCWWCEKGIDGFRMDVISMISKEQSYPDGEIHGGSSYADFGPFVCNGPRVHEYLQEMNREVLSKYNLLTVGETAGVTIEEAKKYANLDGTELGMVFQFEHVDLTVGEFGKRTDERFCLKDLREVLNKWQTELEGKAWNSLYWSNHDQPRAVSRFGNDGPMYRKLSAKMLATCLHMMKGTPYIYQGEELGMTNVPFNSLDDYRDIETFNSYKQLVEIEKSVSHEDMLRYMRKSSRDNARTPMQWNKEKNAGFSEHIPWIMMNPNYQTINAEAEMKDTNSIFHTYQKLIQLRKEYEIITLGKYELIMKDDENIYVYKRLYQDEELYVYCNFTDKEVSYDASILNNEKVLIQNYNQHQKGILKPYESIVFYQKSRA